MEAVDWWINRAFTYGLGFIVIAVLALIFLWLCWRLAVAVNSMFTTASKKFPETIEKYNALMDTLTLSAAKHDSNDNRSTAALEALAKAHSDSSGDKMEIAKELRGLASSQTEILNTSREIHNEIRPVVVALGKLNAKLDKASDGPLIGISSETIEIHETTERRKKPDHPGLREHGE